MLKLRDAAAPADELLQNETTAGAACTLTRRGTVKTSFSKGLLPLILAVCLGAACDLQPKTVPCSNAGDCKSVNERYGYCVQSHCVECLEDSGCGDGNTCNAGTCERHCKSSQNCPTGDVCRDGFCAR